MILIKTIGLRNWNLNFQKKLVSVPENFANLTRIKFGNWSIPQSQNFSKPNFRRNLEILFPFSRTGHAFLPESWETVSASSSNQRRLFLSSEVHFWSKSCLKNLFAFWQVGIDSSVQVSSDAKPCSPDARSLELTCCEPTLKHSLAFCANLLKNTLKVATLYSKT